MSSVAASVLKRSIACTATAKSCSSTGTHQPALKARATRKHHQKEEKKAQTITRRPSAATRWPQISPQDMTNLFEICQFKNHNLFRKNRYWLYLEESLYFFKAVITISTLDLQRSSKLAFQNRGSILFGGKPIKVERNKRKRKSGSFLKRRKNYFERICKKHKFNFEKEESSYFLCTPNWVCG